MILGPTIEERGKGEMKKGKKDRRLERKGEGEGRGGGKRRKGGRTEEAGELKRECEGFYEVSLLYL